MTPCNCPKNAQSLVVGADPPRLTEALAEDPSVKRALSDSAIGGVMLGAGLVTVGFGRDLGRNYVAIAGAAAVILGTIIAVRARTAA